MSGWEHYFSVPTSFEHEGEVSMEKIDFVYLFLPLLAFQQLCGYGTLF